MSRRLSHRGRPVEAEGRWESDRVVVRREDEARELRAVPLGDGSWLLVDGDRQHRVTVARHRGVVWVHGDGRTWRLEESAFDGAAAQAAVGDGRLTAPMPATVLELRCAVGDTVEPGQVLAVVSAMKMQIDVTSPVGGEVRTIAAGVGDQVDGGELLIEISPGETTKDGAE